MELYADHYPIFQANQVLTNDHLNEVFTYLDQQGRHTRSHLIGIGIVCGLEINFQPTGTPTILLNKGCAVTSEGYLIDQHDDASYVSYRPYALPDLPEYRPLKGLALWELMPAGEINTTPIATPPEFLNQKAVLLFLELKQQGLRNCSPNNCDDKGAEVTASIKPLLISISDADKLAATASSLHTGLAPNEIQATVSARLNLPDLALSRFDVPNTDVTMSEDVFAGYLEVFRRENLVQATAKALSAAYAAFRPMLQSSYASDPFVSFANTFGFLERAPVTNNQVLHLQHYYDLFADIISAYDEFRWKGYEFICACCPSTEIFPRHVMLGLIKATESPTPAIYRHRFLPSPAVHDCECETAELLLLFSRLVELTMRFLVPPALPNANEKAAIDPQIRITPSAVSGPLANKAIPYYYELKSPRPLNRLWNPQKSKRNRDNQNLAYRSDEFQPSAPGWIREALRFDLEPYNFFRIEGHLTKDYQRVLSSLLHAQHQHRLPFDVIALRTGAFDNNLQININLQSSRFQDLDVLYQSLQEELNSSLAEATREIYDLPVSKLELPAGTPRHLLISRYAPNYQYRANSVGAWFESKLNRYSTMPYVDLNQDNFDHNALAAIKAQLFPENSGLDSLAQACVIILYYILKLAEQSTASLENLVLSDLQNKYEDLLALLRFARAEMDGINTDTIQLLLFELCEEALLNSQLESIKVVYSEYRRRGLEMQKQQFLGNFLRKHPGIQHRGGVPFGGTFILVYHQEPDLEFEAPIVVKPQFTENIIAEVAAENTVNLRLKPLTRMFEGPTALKSENLAVESEKSAEMSARTFAAMVEQPGATMSEKLVARAEQPAMLRASSAFANKGSQRFAVEKNVQHKAIAAMHSETQLTKALERVSKNAAVANDPDLQMIIGMVKDRPRIIRDESPAFSLDDPASEIIFNTLADLPNGAVIADFYLPYRVSGDFPSVQFVLPKQLPSFSAKMGCANQDDFVVVTIKAKGGMAPYEISIDDGAFQPLDGTISLRAGNHSLKLRDADGAEAQAQGIFVPSQLVLTETDWQCDQSGKFIATISLSGGTSPYTVNGQALEGSVYETSPTPSGGTVEVEVIDHNLCSIKQSFTHVCEQVCTLPCEGIAIRRGFPFWLPEPDDNNPYAVIEIADLKFTIDPDREPAQKIDFSDKVKSMTREMVAAFLPDSLAKLGENWVNAVNKLISEEPKLIGQGAQWLTLGHTPQQPGQNSILSIERFECLSFKLVVSLTIVRKQDKQNLVFDYSPGGCSVTSGRITTFVPPFEGAKLNKCKPDTAEEPFCAKKPEFKLDIQQTDSAGLSIFVTAVTSPQTADLNYVWEAPAGTPAMGNGEKFSTSYDSPGDKMVFVTAYNKQGCKVIAARTFNVG
jgi:hypothetical protein